MIRDRLCAWLAGLLTLAVDALVETAEDDRPRRVHLSFAPDGEPIIADLGRGWSP